MEALLETMKVADEDILKHLRNNGRIKIQELSKKTGVPPSTVFDRLQKLEKERSINHVTHVDYKKYGYETRAMVFIKHPGDKEPLFNYLKTCPRVNNSWRTNNGFDIIIEIITKNLIDLEDFVDKLQSQFNIDDVKTFYLLNQKICEQFKFERFD